MCVSVILPLKYWAGRVRMASAPFFDLTHSWYACHRGPRAFIEHALQAAFVLAEKECPGVISTLQYRAFEKAIPESVAQLVLTVRILADNDFYSQQENVSGDSVSDGSYATHVNLTEQLKTLNLPNTRKCLQQLPQFMKCPQGRLAFSKPLATVITERAIPRC